LILPIFCYANAPCPEYPERCPYFRSDYVHQFLIALPFTLIIELLVLFLLIRIFLDRNKGIKNKNIFIVGGLASILTFPCLWFILPIVTYHGSDFFGLDYVYVGELMVVIVEAIILNRLLHLSLGKSFVASFVINTASAILGALLLSLLF